MKLNEIQISLTEQTAEYENYRMRSQTEIILLKDKISFLESTQSQGNEDEVKELRDELQTMKFSYSKSQNELETNKRRLKEEIFSI